MKSWFVCGLNFKLLNYLEMIAVFFSCRVGLKTFARVGCRYWLITLGILLLTLHLPAQDSIRISGKLLNNTRFPKIVVQKFGTGVYDIAAMAVDKDSGTFSIKAPLDIETGVYRFRYSQTGFGEYVDVIVNGSEKEIYFELDLLPAVNERKPVFKVSEVNRRWYKFREAESVAMLKTNLLDQMLAAWPNETDSLYRSIFKERTKLIAAFWQKRKQYLDREPDFWARAMVANNKPYFAHPRQEWRLQDFYKRGQYWQGLQTNSPELLSTPLYTNLILEYIRYYMNPEMEFTQEQMQAGFIKSVDTIITHFSGNETTRNFAIRYLQLGFKELGMEEVLQYIDQTYASSQCTDGIEDDAMQQRLKGYEAMKEGSPAPDIQWVGMDGNLTGLYNLESDKVLLVFWASWCPHCMEMLPGLNAWAADKHDIQVLAISLDTDATAYTQTVNNYNNMLHFCDYKGWESQPVKDYFIYGTPTYFLLDNKRQILGKFSGFEGVKGFLAKD